MIHAKGTQQHTTANKTKQKCVHEFFVLKTDYANNGNNDSIDYNCNVNVNSQYARQTDEMQPSQLGVNPQTQTQTQTQSYMYSDTQVPTQQRAAVQSNVQQPYYTQYIVPSLYFNSFNFCFMHVFFLDGNACHYTDV